MNRVYRNNNDPSSVVLIHFTRNDISTALATKHDFKRAAIASRT